MKIIILICILLFTINFCAPQSLSTSIEVTPINTFQTKELPKMKQSKIAENFIVDNGYTDLPATVDRKKLFLNQLNGLLMSKRL
jgi:hypothetical protein